MVWEYQCPVDGCEFSKQANKEPTVIESAQDHTRNTHGSTPTREEIEQYVTGPR